MKILLSMFWLCLQNELYQLFLFLFLNLCYNFIMLGRGDFVEKNLVDVYMNYKVQRLQNYGLILMGREDSFLKECLSFYLRTYISSYYYHIFETIDSKDSCSDLDVSLELDGKKLELLDQLADRELIESNDSYVLKKEIILKTRSLFPFLISLDRLRYEEKEQIPSKVSQLLVEYPEISQMLGERLPSLFQAVSNTYNQLQRFFQQDGYYHVDYSLFSDHDNYVFMSLDYQIPLLESNYKRSLVERVYRDKKLLFMKIKVMIQKFILSFLDDYYHGRKIYDRYFLFLPSEIFEKKEDVDVILQMVAQPFLQRYLVLGIPSAISVTQGLFRKYPHFSFACCQDLRYISDVSGKLATLDTSGLYDYLVIEGYKPKSLEEIQKYACVVVRDILFRKDV